MSDEPITPEGNLLADAGELDLVDLSLEFEPREASEIVLALPRTTVRYNVADQSLTLTGADGNPRSAVRGKVESHDGRVRLRFLLDRLSLESFAFGGEKFGSHYVNPEHGADEPSLHSVGGEAWLVSMTVKSLESAWPEEEETASDS
jgi:sucrose-6-phosphate hydrolase SacC (GH32 family)